MKIVYYLFHFLCYMTFILQATCSLIDAERCTKRYGNCRRDCYKREKQIDICFSVRKICCLEIFEDD
ncbi:beta-defensin 114 [Callospermophilus lateralis]|uniref:beta-defensin 114 n=1 Tax=Callospermophilus lateralis TaxID=76772 RepID=UPI004038E4F4